MLHGKRRIVGCSFGGEGSAPGLMRGYRGVRAGTWTKGRLRSKISGGRRALLPHRGMRRGHGAVGGITKAVGKGEKYEAARIVNRRSGGSANKKKKKISGIHGR